MKKNLLLTTLVVLFTSAASMFAQCDNAQKDYVSDNLIINPGFEKGDVEINSSLAYFGDCSEVDALQAPEFYSIPFSGAAAFDCNRFWSSDISASEGDRFMIADLPEILPNQDLWCQKFTVSTDTDFEFTGDFINVLNPLFNSPDPIINVIVRGNVDDLGAFISSQSQSSFTEGQDWTRLSGDFNSGNNTEIKVCVQNVSVGHGGNDIGFDNFSLVQYNCDTTVVPEVVDNSTDFLDCDEMINQDAAALLNGSFEEGNYFLFEDGSINVDQSQIDAWSRAAFDRNIQITDSGHNGVPAYEGNTYSRVNAISNSSIYQDIATMPGDILLYSFAHRGGDGVDQVAVYFGTPKPNGQEPLDSELVNSYATDSDRWVVYQGKYEVPAGQTITRFSLGALRSSNGNIRDGNLIDAVTVQSVEASCENPMKIS